MNNVRKEQNLKKCERKVQEDKGVEKEKERKHVKRVMDDNDNNTTLITIDRDLH